MVNEIEKSAEQQYIDLVTVALDYGNKVDQDRTGTGMYELFGVQLKFDLRKGFPAITSKKVAFKSAVTELLWYFRGEGHTDYLKKHNVKIWDDFVKDDGRSLGPVYGVQMRQWLGENGELFDQLKDVIESIKKNPASRRHIINLWAVHELHKMALPPCPVMFQFNVRGNELNLMVTQRSADLFLGLPFDMIAMSLLLEIIAKETGYEAAWVTYSIGSAHVYYNHEEQVEAMIDRFDQDSRPLPTLMFYKHPGKTFEDYEPSDFKLVGYNPHGPLKGAVSV